jgi:hypothetical protein
MNAFSRAPTVALAAALAALALALAGCGGDQNPVIEGAASTSTSVAAVTSTTGAGTRSGDAIGPTSGAPSGVGINITVRGGSVEGPSRQRVPLNQPVVLRVTSDTADEVHVHGFEKTAEVGPGKVAEISFVANIPGTFEVELERSHRRLTTLEVHP